MTMQVDTAHSLADGSTTPSPTELDKVYDELLLLQDAVLAGRHPTLKLPPAAIAQLKASIAASNALARDSAVPKPNGTVNGAAYTTNPTQLPQPAAPPPTFPGLPELGATPFVGKQPQAFAANHANASHLDPIFLEKAPTLVRAEGKLKRERIERELQAQAEQRKHAARDKDQAGDAPSQVDVDAVLKSAQLLVPPVSGLKADAASNSSFDENDYYSSQVQSAFTADYERLDGGLNPGAVHIGRAPRYDEAAAPVPSRVVSNAYADEDDDMYEPDDEDDDYAPPDASLGDTMLGPIQPVPGRQSGGQVEDDDSDYEPGEITQDSSVPSPRGATYAPYQPAPAPAQVPVIRNHLTHIAAPQPNRVSPLTTAKAPSYELELVNGSPQVVKKPQQYPTYVPPSRASTASPSGNNIAGSGKKKKTKKRKRDIEPTGRAKRRRDRQNATDSGPIGSRQEPYIKDEPVSPPPFANVPDYQTNGRAPPPYRPIEIDLSTPTHAYQPQIRYEQPRSGLRYEYVEPAAPAAVRVASPAHQRPTQRNPQDLRRVASLHNAQRPVSPRGGAYSPVSPYHTRTVSMTYGDARPQGRPQEEVSNRPVYREPASPESPHYPRSERSRSPPRFQEYQDPYVDTPPTRVEMMPPPAAPPRRIIVDQYGNRYMEAGPAPASTPSYVPRASVAPVETRPQPEITYERAPSRHPEAYTPQQPPPSQYDRMPPPPALPSRRTAPEHQYDYADANGTLIREYSRRPEVVSPRYAPQPSSPIYQEVRSFDSIIPPPPRPPAKIPPRESTVRAHGQRSYSVHPEVAPPSVRQGSVAPVQYVRQDAPAPAPARAVSVMPSYRPLPHQQPAPPQRVHSQAPQALPQAQQQQQQTVRYVDQYGNEVFPRQLNEVRY